MNAWDSGTQKDFTKLIVGGSILLGQELQPGEYALQLIVADKLAKEDGRLAAQWIELEIVK